MSALHEEDTRMLRKQYHLSARHVRRLEELSEELGVASEAEVIRRAIDAFDVDSLTPETRELVAETAEALLARIETLNAAIDDTVRRAQVIHERINNPVWIESIRERTRREAEDDPTLVAGVAAVIAT